MLRSMTRMGVAAMLAASATACDFDVTNPGPTPDSFLEKPEAHQAVANGAARQLFDALNEIAYTTSAVTRELFPSGSTSSFGISRDQQTGILRYDDEHVSWTNLQEARYIAESGFVRFEEFSPTGVTGYKPAAYAALWAGYANRLLGENFCEAVIDGGSIEPSTVFLTRAEGWFTKAIEVSSGTASLSKVVQAATAGRASVRMHLGKWSEAVADADDIPTDFTFYAEYWDTQQDHYNRTYFAGADQPYRAVTAWNTVYQAYYTATADPRVPWVNTGQLGDASVGMIGARVPFYRQLKYPDRGSDILLSSGYEMRLIEAESQLKSGNWQQGLTLLNAHRVALGLDPWTATGATEAWTALKRERGIELWIEGRRMGDLRRWKEGGTPGSLDPLETAGNPQSYLLADQSLCYPIPQNERESNPNVPIQPSSTGG